MSIQHMRKTYSMAGLHEKDVDPDPMVQFQKWFHEANQPDLPDWFEVNAMTLSTTDGEGRVSSRIVLLKSAEDGRLMFFTNYESEKARQILSNDHVSLCFLWPHLQRQVRVEGRARKTDRKRSEDYFHTRPRESQIGAHVSSQSNVIESREVLEKGFAEVEARFANGDVTCPDNWGGYEVAPERIEFWQGRPGRLHDRICYLKRSDRWEIVRLAP